MKRSLLLLIALLALLGADCAAPREQAEGPAAGGPLAPLGVGRTLICRAYEDSGNITEDQPMWPAHLVTLFVTGKNPHSPIHTLQEHVNWVNDPAHSYVDDGTGGLCVWAHPRRTDAAAMVAIRGLAGMELSCGGDSARRERLWDEVLTLCHDGGRPYLWGFASDDTHSRRQDRIGLSFLVARMPEFSERALKSALRSGAFYVSNGPLISDIGVTGATITLTLPQRGEVRWLKSGQFGVGPAVVGPGRGPDRCLRRERGVTTSSYTLGPADGTTTPSAARFVRAIVIGPGGRIAHTMPFRILSARAVANPYPASGGWYRGMTHNHCDASGRKRVPIHDFHRAYRRRGHHWAFATDYGYWLTPFQRYPEGAIPVVRGVRPDRAGPGQAVRLTLFGSHFGYRSTVLIGGHPTTGFRWVFDNRIEVTAPADLPVGSHDVTVVDASGFKDTLPLAYTVQERTADNAGWTTHSTANGALPADRTFCVAFKGTDTWVGTQFGAAKFDGARWHPVTRSTNDHIGSAIVDIAADRKGNVYFASFRGLTRLAPDGSWRLFGTRDGLPSREVNRVFVDSKDRVWISYNGRSSKVSRFNGKTWRSFQPPNAARRRMSLAIAEAADGRMLVAPRNAGVGVFDGTKWEVWTPKNTGLADSFVRHIRRGRDGALYFATTSLKLEPAGGLSVLRGGKWTTHRQSKNGLASYRVWDVCADRRGNVWCATSRGVSRLSPDGRWRTYTMRNSGLAFDFVMGIGEAPDGALWFATARGVSRYQARQ